MAAASSEKQHLQSSEMGMMTTRVRGRLRSLHKIYRFDPKVRDEKIAETGEYGV